MATAVCLGPCMVVTACHVQPDPAVLLAPFVTQGTCCFTARLQRVWSCLSVRDNRLLVCVQVKTRSHQLIRDVKNFGSGGSVRVGRLPPHSSKITRIIYKLFNFVTNSGAQLCHTRNVYTRRCSRPRF